MMRRSLVTFVVTSLVFPVLAACGGTDKAQEKAVEKQIEKAAKSAGDDVKVDVNDGEVKIESKDGSFVTGGDLPQDFPADDIPLADAEVLSAVGVKGQGYNVLMKYDGSTDDAFKEAIDLLTGAGFTVDKQSPLASAQTAQLNSAKYQVTVIAGDGSLNYSIKLK